ncbi:ribosomal protein-like protein S15 [Aaosphaeria arxii CBS 175.79]|uniref:Ribosomal protein-like protein S15 n=1 Tax=Aaosphaeria arxii CBS 175.79 TaxID=1450172 RepID=A0A6A5Y522_9PLEO|nr:ribosomal protein-like protein S15 [Aaosphaeria arxii CBS 175.79]KAF2020137.1 ribosomal protein-like protein S15 [Aaosphaeria arxii CBS 175.79]
MPPRIPILSCLRASTSTAPTQFTLPLRPFSSTAIPQSKFAARPKKKTSHDPYIVAQRNRKKAANLTRRSEIEQKRIENLGDPVRGINTAFVESFATATPIEHTSDKIPKETSHLNYALKPEGLERALKKSEELAVPRKIERVQKAQTYAWSPYMNPSKSNEAAETEEDLEVRRQKDHERATEAIKRITALDNGSSKDRMRVNIARCVSTFGRHNTDPIFPPRAPPLHAVNSKTSHAIRPETNVEQTKKRVGPDTGSSEVQIAILTAKIKAVADFVATRGKGDKHNKRNLRLLVHRRQKLLQYLRRKERGGPRWQHCIETLGLTEGTWRGEISM